MPQRAFDREHRVGIRAHRHAFDEDALLRQRPQPREQRGAFGRRQGDPDAVIALLEPLQRHYAALSADPATLETSLMLTVIFNENFDQTKANPRMVAGGAAQIARSIESTNNVLATLDIRLLLIALAANAIAALVVGLLYLAGGILWMKLKYG